MPHTRFFFVWFQYLLSSGIGIAKAIVSLTLFHEGRLVLQDAFKSYNEKHGHYVPETHYVVS